MVSKFTLLSSLLLASVALAAPSLVEDPSTRGHEDRRSRPISRVASGEPTTHYIAGAILNNKNKGTFVNISGNFIVPTIRGLDGNGSALLILDDSRCQVAYVLAGITFARRNGKTSYHAWYQRYPSKMELINDDKLTVKAGDHITISILTTPGGSAVTILIMNLTTGGKVVKELKDATHRLCLRSAGWTVEDHLGIDPFVNFGTVSLTGVAHSDRKLYYPSDATLVNINRGGADLTSVSLSPDGHTVTITEHVNK